MRAILFVCLSVLVCIASARTIGWTGAAGNGLWSFAGNWDANVVPSNADDVTINVPGGTTVSVSSPAAANSVTIGGGSQYYQTLNLLSSLAVGNGGIRVLSFGTLQVSTNNDQPLSSTGTVNVIGGAFIYASGDVTGPGQYVIQSGAGIVFSGPALKLVDRANFTIWGVATIQPTTIQFARGGALYFYGNTTATGAINVFSQDNANNLFYAANNFTYIGGPTSGGSPLNFQVNTTFLTPLNIVSGAVTVTTQANFNGGVVLPTGTTLTVQAGLSGTYYRSITGAGTLQINSIADVVQLIGPSTIIASSGSLTVESTSNVPTLNVGGKLIINAGTFTTSSLTIAAGTVTGAGILRSTGTAVISPAASGGNSNSFISAEIQIAGTGSTSGANNVLFATGGNLHITSSGSFSIGATTTFAKQTGNPVVTNEGAFTVNIPAGAVFTTSVDFNGPNGVLSFTGGLVIFQGGKSVANKVALSAVLVEFATATAQWGAVTGTGSINITANPAATSTFGTIQAAYFGTINGQVQIASLTANTLELFNGQTTLTGASSAVIFNYYGGILQGTTLQTTNVVLTANTPITLNTVRITAKTLKLTPTANPATITDQNGATITVGN